MSDSEFLPHHMTKEEVVKHLNSSLETGLSQDQIPDLREKYGFNELPPEEKESIWEKIREQFEDPMVKILLAAACISFLISTFSPSDEDDSLPSWIEPLVIFLILIANGFIGIYQDLGAEKSLEMLKKMESVKSDVLRDNKWQMIESRELLPGDIIRVKTGDMVPADSRTLLMESGDVLVNQAFLTGESCSVDKVLGAVKKDSDNLEKENILFSGSLVELGSVIAVVVATGQNAELGNINKALQEATEDTKDDTTLLKQQLDDFGDMLTKYIAIACIIIWVFNLAKFSDPVHGGWVNGALYYFKTAVALGVAAIPEGLPAVITTCLALGTRRMIKRNALVRKLSKVETLGCTTVICSDKTGTLTQNEMFAQRLLLIDSRDVFESLEVDGHSYDSSTGGIIHLDKIESEGSFLSKLWINLVKNTQTRFIRKERKGVKDLSSQESNKNIVQIKCIGAPTEGALLCLGEKLQKQTDLQKTEVNKIWTIPFTSARKCMSIITKSENSGTELYIKGASEVILNKSTRFINSKGEIKDITPDKRKEFENDILLQAREGYRLLAVGFRPAQDLPKFQSFDGSEDITHECYSYLKNKKNLDELESNIVIQAIVAIQDPIKPECKEAIKIAKRAGINVVMITGDYTETSISIANQLDMFNEESRYRSSSLNKFQHSDKVFSGKDWRKLLNEEKLEVLQTNMKNLESLVFARTSPDDKRQLVKLLTQSNEIVAMTGDGVNDASALKQASIGISMGLNGTDVAKEASDLVLMDDNFSTIVKAIEEGRAIYSNMKAFIRYMISSNIGEVFSIFLTCIIGLPEGFNSLQLLWVNLVTDGLPATALSFNKSDSEVMLKKPRRRGEKIVDNWILMRYLVVGLYVGIATTGIFVYYYTSYNWSNDNQTLVSFWELRNWTTCSNWIGEKSINGFEANACSYFSQGKVKASTLSLTVLVVIEMLNSLNALSENRSLFEIGVFSNIWLHLAILTSIGIHCLMLYVPFFAKVFSTVPLSINDWILVFLFSMPVIFIEEVLKWISREKFKFGKTKLKAD
jgi:Ca2+-transporting ATPase